MNTHKPYFMVAPLLIVSLALSGCAAFAPAATNTPPAPTRTPRPTVRPTSTAKPTKTPLPTPTPNLTATQQANDFIAQVQQYYDAKYISTLDGHYTLLGDAKHSWAQGEYYQWWNTGSLPTDFVLNSDIAWNSSSLSSNTVSGCGFVFRLQNGGSSQSSKRTYYVIFVSLAGYVYYWSDTGNNTKFMGSAYYGPGKQIGAVAFGLIVESNQFRVLINGKSIKTFSGYSANFNQGGLAYTVISGTNKGTGTNCEFNNTRLWTMIH